MHWEIQGKKSEHVFANEKSTFDKNSVPVDSYSEVTEVLEVSKNEKMKAYT